MAEIVWSDAAIADLDAIADYIALENRVAARALVSRVIGHVEQLRVHPRSGSFPAEFVGKRYRQIVEPPCRIFYRVENARVLIVHVLRFERPLDRRSLARP